MAEIIDVLSCDTESCAIFTVNTAVESVVVPVGLSRILYNGNGKFKFAAGDNFILMSMGFILPEQFTFFKDAPNNHACFEIQPWGLTSNFPYFFQNLGSRVLLPLENYELGIGTYFECEECKRVVDPSKTLLTEDFQLNINFRKIPNISMLNVPAAYNGKTFYIIPFVKILHNIALVA